MRARSERSRDTLVELGDATSGSVTSPLLVAGANGEVIAGGLDESFFLELNRLF